jgi:hypothetical protein
MVTALPQRAKVIADDASMHRTIAEREDSNPGEPKAAKSPRISDPLLPAV